MDDDDSQAIRVKVQKALRCWARLSKVLKGENADTQVCS